MIDADGHVRRNGRKLEFLDLAADELRYSTGFSFKVERNSAGDR